MPKLLDDLQFSLASNLVRRASNRCSTWAENYVTLGKPVPGPMRFTRFPWSKKWVDLSQSWAGRKAAQMAMTNSAIVRAIFNIDIRKVDVLYILPKKNPDAADFSKTKFDALLESSPHLQNLFNNIRNIGLKQSGSNNLYIRGARSKSGLKSISVGVIVWDEFDEMPQAHISLAEERASGYEEADKQDIKISTPTVPEFGIDAIYNEGNQQHFIFKCPNCGQWRELLPPPYDITESLVITADDYKDLKSLKNSYYTCHKGGCRLPVDPDAKAEFFKDSMWVPTVKDNDFNTFWIPQLYSTTMQPWRIAKSYLRALIDPKEEQEYFNSKLGLPKVVAGARVDDDDINKCQAKGGGYLIPEPPPAMGIVTMGVDVGKVLHVEIDRWYLPPVIGKDLNTNAIPKPIFAKTTKDFEQLDILMHEYNVSHCVIDYEPETRKAQEFAHRFDGRVHLAYPHRGMSERQISVKAESSQIGFRRTSWLDLSQGRFKRQAILLPKNITVEYREAVKALIRHEKENKEGDLVATYISVGADHEAFARMYNELALLFAVSGRENQDVSYYL